MKAKKAVQKKMYCENSWDDGRQRFYFNKISLPFLKGSSQTARVSRDLTNQNATQFENTETEKGPGRERRHERAKNKVTDADSAKHIFVL